MKIKSYEKLKRKFSVSFNCRNKTAHLYVYSVGMLNVSLKKRGGGDKIEK